MVDFSKKLAKAKSAWKNAMKKKPDFGSDLPDGTYHVRLTTAEVVESQSSGNLQVHWAAVVLEGESKGDKLNWYSQLKTEDNMMYLQRDITKLGEESPEDPTELEDTLKSISKKKPAVKVSVKTNGDFQNVRFGKLLTDEDVADDDEEEVEESESEEEETEEEDEAPAKKKKAKAEDEEEEADAEEEEEPAKEDDEEPEAEPEAEEEEEAEESEEEEVLEIGKRYAFDLKGKEVIGVSQKFNKKAGTVTMKVDGYKPFDVKAEKLRPAPKSKVTKK
jgi:cobalamin biosynthesis protein CobT